MKRHRAHGVRTQSSKDIVHGNYLLTTEITQGGGMEIAPAQSPTTLPASTNTLK